MRWLLPLVLFAAPCYADSCTSFNQFQFSPYELERCIKEMKYLNDLRLQTLEIENRLLRNQVCDLALEINKISPASDIVGVSCLNMGRTKPAPTKPPMKPTPPPALH